ncbi:unnamed protein product [Schistosoma margrebowiei]|uniref:Uncharacterized protein n=1 Tax=Schistosoma margrebowiei TaxID=48269 RepID=A0AA85A9Q7_9TREM|nr:unnamed protein product [Schistosoma margrebowiei]
MRFLAYIFVYLFQVIYSIFRPMIKYISRLVTGRCELSRIIADCPKGAPRTVRIENALRNSKNKSIQNGLLLEKCADAKSHVQFVISAKRIDLKDQPNFPTDYLYCISQINSYRELINKLDASRCTAFNSDDHYHSELLSRVVFLTSDLKFCSYGFVLILKTNCHPIMERSGLFLGFRRRTPKRISAEWVYCLLKILCTSQNHIRN